MDKPKQIINRICLIIIMMISILLLKNNNVFAESEAYYIGSKNATKATGYVEAKDKEKNIEVTLDLSQPLDKMLYYILTYEEYEDKTYIGNDSELKLNDRKQNALYYFIYNYAHYYCNNRSK